MLFPSSWECFPASQPRWDFSGHNSCCCALSNARTHSWEGAVPAPGARPAESPAPPRSRSCRSRRSSPRCCGCSLCFCSPLGLSGEVEEGPLQAHRAFLQTSSQRHPAKKKKGGKLVTKGALAANSSLWSLKHIRGRVFVHHK